MGPKKLNSDILSGLVKKPKNGTRDPIENISAKTLTTINIKSIRISYLLFLLSNLNNFFAISKEPISFLFDTRAFSLLNNITRIQSFFSRNI